MCPKVVTPTIEETLALLAGRVRHLESLEPLGLWFVRADKDGDGDYDPLTAAAWENVTKVGNGTINWNAVFGVPTDAKVVALIILGIDAAASRVFQMKARVGTTNYSFEPTTQVANIAIRSHGVVAIAADGTSYYNFNAAWDFFYLRVVGWYI